MKVLCEDNKRRRTARENVCDEEEIQEELRG